MDWKFLLVTHFLAVCAGGAIVYIFYRPIIAAYNDVNSGVKHAVNTFKKVKAAVK